MTATELIEHVLPNGPLAGKRSSAVPGRPQPAPSEAAQQIVQVLLGEESLAESPLSEASVHRSRRSRIWNAVFTGAAGGQVWRSTGLADRDQALMVARKWEAEARAERARLGRIARPPNLRVRRPQIGFGPPLLTQKEVALILDMSERGVRAVERRAFQKLRSHPVMRQIRHQYLAGELDEHYVVLTHDEIEALFSLARTPEERHVIEKVLALIHTGRD